MAVRARQKIRKDQIMSDHSFADLDRLRLIKACDETIKMIEKRRNVYREEEIDRLMKPRFFGTMSREKAEFEADHPPGLAGSYHLYYAWRSLDVARKLMALAEASAETTVSVSTSDFDDISYGWRMTRPKPSLIEG